jgi:hypothetical protein
MGQAMNHEGLAALLAEALNNPLAPMGWALDQREAVEAAVARLSAILRQSRDAAAGQKVLFRMPTRRQDAPYLFTEKMLSDYRSLYPAVDIEAQVRAMIGWLEAHPINRKTHTGMPAFINRWLAREQNGSRPATVSARRQSDYDYIAANRHKG